MRQWQLPSDKALRDFIDMVEGIDDDSAYVPDFVSGTVMSIVDPSDEFVDALAAVGAQEITGLADRGQAEYEGTLVEWHEPDNPSLKPKLPSRPAPHWRRREIGSRPSMIRDSVVGAWRTLLRGR